MPKKEKVKSPKMPISPKQNELMDTPFGVSNLANYLGFIRQYNRIYLITALSFSIQS